MPTPEIELFADEDNQKIFDILKQHSTKNFVRRIMNPYVFPSLDIGGGKSGTHLMSWSTVGDKYIAYPLIVQGSNGQLVQMDNEKAIDYALKNNEYIPFSSSYEADWFTKNYKNFWRSR